MRILITTLFLVAACVPRDSRAMKLTAGGAPACDVDCVSPPPLQIKYLGVTLPRSTKRYCEFEPGLQHSMVQVRFEFDPADMPALEARLPCRLGPISTGPVDHATVGT